MAGQALTVARRTKQGRRWLATGVGAGTMLVGALAGATAAAAQSTRAGEAVVVAGEGSTRPLGEGGSATEFSLRLPDGASCPGDSANDGFRVQSFIVPAADDPGKLRYKSTSPEGGGRYALYDVFTRPYVQGFTAEADGPDQTGLIVNIPTFSFAVFPPGELGEGPYRVGIACTLINETVRYWDTEMVLRRAPDDPPAEIHWTVPGADSAPTGWSQMAITGIGVASLALAVAVTFARRRKQLRRVQMSTEDQ